MRYRVFLKETEEGVAASVPSLPGCHSQGGTQKEALVNITDAIREYLEAAEAIYRDEQYQEIDVEV